MENQEFLNAYPRNLPEYTLDIQVEGIDLGESRHWSHRFGELLHDTMSGKDPQLSTDDLQGYSNWLQTGAEQVRSQAIHLENAEAGSRILNELNFHALNRCMLLPWMLLAQASIGKVPPISEVAQISQDLLALQGLRYYADREAVASKKGGYRYFNPANTPWRESFEGSIHEYDAGIVLLEMMRRNKDFVVVPAPIQFESHSRPTGLDNLKNNADFIAVQADRAIGVQVKGFVTDEKLNRYNSKRIVFIDAQADFASNRLMRTQQESTRQRYVAWGGLICAERANKIPDHGKNAIVYSQDRARVLRSKFLARQMIGAARPQLDIATRIISDRVLKAINLN